LNLGRLVASLNRPGGNLTGVSFLNSVLAAKRLELLHQIAPKATIIAAMSENSSSPDIEAERRDLLAAAQAIGQQLIVLDVSSDRESNSQPNCEDNQDIGHTYPTVS
jgi:putative ABC transport system substrate-binding protein